MYRHHAAETQECKLDTCDGGLVWLSGNHCWFGSWCAPELPRRQPPRPLQKTPQTICSGRFPESRCCRTPVFLDEKIHDLLGQEFWNRVSPIAFDISKSSPKESSRGTFWNLESNLLGALLEMSNPICSGHFLEISNPICSGHFQEISNPVCSGGAFWKSRIQFARGAFWNSCLLGALRKRLSQQVLSPGG